MLSRGLFFCNLARSLIKALILNVFLGLPFLTSSSNLYPHSGEIMKLLLPFFVALLMLNSLVIAEQSAAPVETPMNETPSSASDSTKSEAPRKKMKKAKKVDSENKKTQENNSVDDAPPAPPVY